MCSSDLVNENICSGLCGSLGSWVTDPVLLLISGGLFGNSAGRSTAVLLRTAVPGGYGQGKQPRLAIQNGDVKLLETLNTIYL